VLPTL
jgi:hypothetical protein